MKTKTFSPFSFVLSVIKPYKFAYFVMMLAPITNGIYPVINNYAVKLLIDLFTTESKLTFDQSLKPVLVFIGAQALLDVAWRCHNFAQLKSIPYILEDILCRVCEHCFHLPYAYFQNNLSGSIVGKVKGIGDKFFKIHMGLEWKVSKPFYTTLFSGIALAFANISIFYFILGFTLIYSPVAFYFFYKLSKIEGEKQDSWYYLFGTVADRISNIFNIFAFARKKKELQNIHDYYQNVHNPLAIKFFKYDLMISIVLSLFYWVFVIFVFAYVIHLKNKAVISTGDIAFILALTFSFTESSWDMTVQMKEFLEDVAAFKSAYTIMKVEPCHIDKKDAVALSVPRAEIICNDLTFRYPDGHIVLNKLNLTIKAGEKVGIVGQSGAGKSTFIAMLMKNFKPGGGKIVIDGQDIADVTSDSLRENISYIPQDIILFHRSIYDNIAYAKEEATKDEIERAAQHAKIHDFIMSLENGYDTLVGERGIKLSSGQRQRIAIARAFLKNAKILILDEATSSLDSETESDIQNSLDKIFREKNTTVIAIAHRLSTIKHMDRIVVIENGQVVEDGTFEQLLKINEGKFKALWEHQVNGMIV